MLRVGFVWLCAAAVLPAADRKIDFARDVEPLLQSRCLVCHGAQQQMSGLRLDTREGALKGGTSGVDIKPGTATAAASSGWFPGARARRSCRRWARG